jgi:ribosomal protein S18 acetylase RimI-like enzyme
LLDFLLKQVGSLAILSVPKSNHLAIGFYEAVAFTITSEFETTYNGIPVLVNVMIRQVSAD